MQRSAFIIALFSLFAFFSLALASPLPVGVTQEVRETTAELSAREVTVDPKILHREVSTDTESDINLHILAREHKAFEDYVQEMTGENVERDTQDLDTEDLEPRVCRQRLCG
jgi:hypothetical protein